jgi:hypothetical protein
VLDTLHVSPDLQRRLRESVTDTAFHRFVAETTADVEEITAHLAGGKIGVEEWSGIMLDTLAEAHAQAGFLGRQRAGDRAPFDTDDTRFGQLVAQEEWPFLSGFAHDIATGRYTGEDGTLDVEAIRRRAGLYVARVFGTANEALLLTSGEKVWWILGDKDHCSGCLRLAAGSPYGPGELKVAPRSGATQCLSQCGCVCRTDSGLETFNPS